MYLKVHVTPKSRRELVTVKNSTTLVISVKEPAEGNRANVRVLELVAKHFKIPLGKIRIINGHHSPHKMLSLEIEEKLL